MMLKGDDENNLGISFTYLLMILSMSSSDTFISLFPVGNWNTNPNNNDETSFVQNDDETSFVQNGDET